MVRTSWKEIQGSSLQRIFNHEVGVRSEGFINFNINYPLWVMLFDYFYLPNMHFASFWLHVQNVHIGPHSSGHCSQKLSLLWNVAPQIALRLVIGVGTVQIIIFSNDCISCGKKVMLGAGQQRYFLFWETFHVIRKVRVAWGDGKQL